MSSLKKQLDQMRINSEEIERKYRDSLKENQKLTEQFKRVATASGDCEELRMQNKDLLRKLDQEKEIRRTSIQKAKEVVSRAKEDMANKMGKVFCAFLLLTGSRAVVVLVK